MNCHDCIYDKECHHANPDIICNKFKIKEEEKLIDERELEEFRFRRIVTI